jgi:hypothetical protein
MEAGLARLARQPGKRDEFLLCLYEKISSRLPGQFCCFDIDLTVVHPGNRVSPLASVYMEKFPSRLARSRLFQAGQPTCPYKRTIIFTIKITTQRDLAYRAVSLSGLARLPYKQALRLMICQTEDMS